MEGLPVDVEMDIDWMEIGEKYIQELTKERIAKIFENKELWLETPCKMKQLDGVVFDTLINTFNIPNVSAVLVTDMEGYRIYGMLAAYSDCSVKLLFLGDGDEKCGLASMKLKK